VEGGDKMYSSGSRQYVFKQSSGKVWNFYYDEKLGICYSTLTRHNTWSNPVIIQKDVHPPFYADIDEYDRFNILFQDKLGNILYSLIEDGEIKTVPVLNSKSPTAYNKYLYLVPMKNIMHFFFVLQHGTSSIFAHQTLNDGKVDTPKVIDYISKSSQPYSIVRDRTDNIYAFYNLSDSKHSQIGYKKYASSRKFWGEFTPIAKHEAGCEFPRTIVDRGNVMHICYQRRSARQYELLYQQKIPDRNIWTGETVVHSSAYPFPEASILCVSETIIIYWVRNDAIFHSYSKNMGNSWSKPLKYNFPAGKQLMCVSYRSNSPYEAEKIAAGDIPGSFVNGLKFAFYQDASGSDRNVPADELKNIIVDSLKMLKASIDELKDAESSIKNEISHLARAQEAAEREIEKYSVRLSLIENQLGDIKSISSRVNSYKNMLNELKSAMESRQEDIRNLQNELTDLKKSSPAKKYKIQGKSDVKYIEKEEDKNE